jgi:phage terminase small subunit
MVMKTLSYRQENFCQLFVRDGNASSAAHYAGYRPSSRRQQGWRLMKTARIRDRIREIQIGLAGDHGRDRDVLIGKLENIYRRAIENHQYHAATRAIEAQARLSAMASPRAEDADGGEKSPAASPVLVKM